MCNPEVIGDVIYRINCKYIKVGEVRIDISAVKSADGQGEEGEDEINDGNSEETHIDLIYNYDLIELEDFKFEEYVSFIATYCQEVQKKLESEGKEFDPLFRKKVGTFIKSVMPRKDSMKYYIAKDSDVTTMIILVEFSSDDTIFAYFIKEGLVAQKF